MNDPQDQDKSVTTDETGKSFVDLGESTSHSAEVGNGPKDGGNPGPLTGIPRPTGYEPKHGDSSEGHERFRQIDEDMVKQFANFTATITDLEEKIENVLIKHSAEYANLDKKFEDVEKIHVNMKERMDLFEPRFATWETHYNQLNRRLQEIEPSVKKKDAPGSPTMTKLLHENDKLENKSLY